VRCAACSYPQLYVACNFAYSLVTARAKQLIMSSSSLPTMSELQARKEQAEKIREEKERELITRQKQDAINRQLIEKEVKAKMDKWRLEEQRKRTDYIFKQNDPDVWDAMIAKWDIPARIIKANTQGSRSTWFCIKDIYTENHRPLMNHLRQKYKDSPEYKFSFDEYDGGYKRYEARDCIKVEW
jgi:hypothetical protein